MKTVLVIEDDPNILNIVNINLQNEGFVVESSMNGKEGLELLKKKTFDLLLLDLMLPGIDGLEICREARKMSRYIPIIIISAKSAEPQRIVGLEIGADDYISKPFSIHELIARIRALLRRVEALNCSSKDQSIEIVAGDLIIRPLPREVLLASLPITLTQKEFDLLLFFARNPGKAYTRLELLDQVWGYSYDGYEHTVNSHINRLRAKIETNLNQPDYIQTVWGVGYRFADFSKKNK
jgi:two-component system, OmpR family, response regulator